MMNRIKVLFIFWTENERPTVGLVKFHLFVVRLLSSNFLVSLWSIWCRVMKY